MPSGALSVAGVAAVLKANLLASGGAVLALIAVALLAVLALRQVTPAPVDAPPASAGVVVLPTSPGTQAAASTPVSVPTGKPAGGAYELKRPEVAAQPTPAGAPPLAARNVAPASATPAGAAAGRSAAAASLAPFAFEAKAFVKENEKEKEHDAKVLLSEGIVTVTVRLDRSSEAVLSTIPFGSVRSVSYSKSKQPLWTTPSGPKQVFRLDAALGFFKGDRHWLSLRTNDAFIVLRIDGDDVNSVVAALEERTGRAVERLADRKDNK
jgi:hypothetical protein